MGDTATYDTSSGTYKAPKRYIYDTSSGTWKEITKQWVYSTSLSAWVVIYESVLPDPTNLTVSYVDAIVTGVELNWTDNSETEDEFRVYRSDNGSAFSEITSVASDQTTYTDSSVSQGNDYTYYVTAWEEVAGESGTTNQEDANWPNDPTNATIDSISASSIDISWTDNSDNETSWVIERSTNGGSFSQIASPATSNSAGTGGTETYTDSSVSSGDTYEYRVKAIGDGDASMESGYSSTGSAVAEDPPTAPSNLSVADGTDPSTEIDFTWDDNSTNEEQWEIWADDGSGFSLHTTINSGTEGTTGTRTFTDDGYTPNVTYDLKIRACNGSGCSGYSNTVTHTTSEGFTGLLSPASDGSTGSWSANGDTTLSACTDEINHDGDTTYASATEDQGTESTPATVNLASGGSQNTNPNAAHTIVATVRQSVINNSGSANGTFSIDLVDNDAATNPIATLSGDPGAYAEFTKTLSSSERDSLSGYDTLEFEFDMDGTFGDSIDSASIHITNAYLVVGTPDAPSGLTASESGTNQINLSWTDNSDNESEFRIERDSGGGFTQIDTVDANSTSYSDTGLSSNTTYTYRVRACNTNGCSNYSNQDSATTAHNPPSAPSNLTATAISSSRIDLSWTDNSSNEDEFRIYRAGTQIDTVGANTTTYSDTGLSSDTSYCYEVQACNTGGCSSFSNQDCATTDPTVPSAPSNCTVTTDASTALTVSWNDNSTNEDDFDIYRDGSFLTTVGANTTSHQDTGLNAETQYSYKVRACNTAGCSSFSNTDSAYTELPTPTSFIVSAQSSSQIDLSWDDDSTENDNYEIYRDGSLHDTVSGTATSYSDTGLSASTQYCYKIRATDATIPSSDFTSESCDTTSAGFTHPHDLMLTDSTFCEQGQFTDTPHYDITLEWTDDQDSGKTVSHVEIWRKADGESSYTEIDTDSYAGVGNQNFYTDGDDSKGGGTHCYKVRNQYSDGTHSSYSSAECITISNPCI